MVINTETGEECPRARFDEHGRLLNAEEAIGELVSQTGSAGFEGYWRNADAEAARVRNGWYWTGDLAYRDEDDFFYFGGRDFDWLRVDGRTSPRPRWRASSSDTPTWCWPRSTRSPTPRWATR